MSKARY